MVAIFYGWTLRWCLCRSSPPSRPEAMHGFTPWPALTGGALIGLGAVLLMWLNGRVAGVSGIAAGVWFGAWRERAWRLWFLAGLVLGTALWAHSGATLAVPRSGVSPWRLALAGLLVGYGTALAHGCTSGHGVCGLARGSLRSAVATAVFMAAALLTTFVVRHGLHWP